MIERCKTTPPLTDSEMFRKLCKELYDKHSQPDRESTLRLMEWYLAQSDTNKTKDLVSYWDDGDADMMRFLKRKPQEAVELTAEDMRYALHTLWMVASRLKAQLKEALDFQDYEARMTAAVTKAASTVDMLKAEIEEYKVALNRVSERPVQFAGKFLSFEE